MNIKKFICRMNFITQFHIKIVQLMNKIVYRTEGEIFSELRKEDCMRNERKDR